MRHGVPLEELTPAQRERGLALLAACLSDRGFTTVRDVMSLNHFIGEVTGRWEEYGEWLYWLSVMGTPSASEPWGWQIDGHHLIVNCFVLGDQLVMTPTFLGSEPVTADSGQHAGIRVFGAEEAKGLALMRALVAGAARAGHARPGAADRAVHGGVPRQLRDEVRGHPLRRALARAAGRAARPSRRLRGADAARPRGDPHGRGAPPSRPTRGSRGWAAPGDTSVFYYRIHSPVILVEFDHQRGIALDNDQPSRDHIHTVVRTPNGNDYGKRSAAPALRALRPLARRPRSAPVTAAAERPGEAAHDWRR